MSGESGDRDRERAESGVGAENGEGATDDEATGAEAGAGEEETEPDEAGEEETEANADTEAAETGEGEAADTEMESADAEGEAADTEGESAEPGRAREALRTVTPSYFGRPDAEMDTIGWGVFLGMLVILVPLLPFLVIVWAISKVIETINPRG